MKPKRWRIVEQLLRQIEGTTGRLVMAVAPDPVDVVFYEAPVFAQTQPPYNPLRGFVQEAVSLLGQPTAVQISGFLRLPERVVELILGNLLQLGGASIDAAGRWDIPAGAPIFKPGSGDPPIWRETRRLLCFWPERQVMLPVLPRLRLRDLVGMGVHNLQNEVAEWYAQFAAWSKCEGARLGLPNTIRLRPLCGSASETGMPTETAFPDSPVAREQILVSNCKLEIFGLTWADYQKESGVWELTSRLWSQPALTGNEHRQMLAPGDQFRGVWLLEQLLKGEHPLDSLGHLFDPKSDRWRSLLDEQDGRSEVKRNLEADWPSFLSIEKNQLDARRRWTGMSTPMARDARLICVSLPANPRAGKNG